MKRHMSWLHTVAVVGVVLLVAVVGTKPPDVLADPKGFVFRPLAFLGTPTPEEGDTFLAVFESNRINNRGDVLFGTEVPREVPTEFEFGLFLLRNGEIAQIARAGEPAPGGGVLRPRLSVAHHPQRPGRCGFCLPARPIQFPRRGERGCLSLFPKQPHRGPGHEARGDQGTWRRVVRGSAPSVSVSIIGETWFSRALCRQRRASTSPTRTISDWGWGSSRRTRKGISPAWSARGIQRPEAVSSTMLPVRGRTTGAMSPSRAMSLARSVVPPGFPPQAIVIGCLSSVYVKEAATGKIRSIARAGDPAPGGGRVTARLKAQ